MQFDGNTIRAQHLAWPAHFKLSVIPSLPMSLRVDLIAVNTRDDLNDDSTQDALARLGCCRRMVLRTLEVSTEFQKLPALHLTQRRRSSRLHFLSESKGF